MRMSDQWTCNMAGKTNPMKAICAWCGAAIACADDSEPSCAEISHGICAPCVENLSFEEGVTVQRFIDSLPVPVLVVDADCRTEGMNRSACEELALRSESVQHELLGDVFTCVNSRMPGGCGRTIHCSGCAIRRAVTHTFATGDPQVFPATLAVGDPDQPAQIDLVITTIKTEGMVLLRLERLRA